MIITTHWFPLQSSWDMRVFPKQEDNNRQYYSPTMHLYYGKQFDVDPQLMTQINLSMNRTDFIKLDEHNVQEFAIVTATDSEHYGGAYHLVSRIQQHLPNRSVIIYDLGMSNGEIDELSAACGVTIRNFDFNRYPPHVRWLGSYAWKSLMIHEVLAEWSGVLWLDTSVRVKHGNFGRTYATALRSDGLVLFMGTTYTMYSVTHPQMYRYLPSDLRKLRTNVMREANEVLIYRTQSVYENVMYWWALCSLDPQCIAPTWNWLCIWQLLSITNLLYCHKYDASALMILAANHYNFQLRAYTEPPSVKPLHYIRHGPKAGHVRQCRRNK